ncbi:hypothetical protein C8J56DRAFT_1126174 [Mycena floridula]|nr:hypothetical protein C8J56DRAFT_1126174 [Mycena floridula]
MFSYSTSPGQYKLLLKHDFMAFCTNIWKAEMLAHVLGHSFRIGGAVELLLAGVPPEIVAATGGWTSLAFLLYWRRMEEILPMSTSRAYKRKHVEELAQLFEKRTYLFTSPSLMSQGLVSFMANFIDKVQKALKEGDLMRGLKSTLDQPGPTWSKTVIAIANDDYFCSSAPDNEFFFSAVSALKPFTGQYETESGTFHFERLSAPVAFFPTGAVLLVQPGPIANWALSLAFPRLCVLSDANDKYFAQLRRDITLNKRSGLKTRSYFTVLETIGLREVDVTVGLAPLIPVILQRISPYYLERCPQSLLPFLATRLIPTRLRPFHPSVQTQSSNSDASGGEECWSERHEQCDSEGDEQCECWSGRDVTTTEKSQKLKKDSLTSSPRRLHQSRSQAPQLLGARERCVAGEAEVFICFLASIGVYGQQQYAQQGYGPQGYRQQQMHPGYGAGASYESGLALYDRGSEYEELESKPEPKPYDIEGHLPVQQQAASE